MTTTLNFNLRHAIDAEEIVNDNSNWDIHQFIMELAGKVDQPDFTERLIESLTKLEQEQL